MRVLMVGPDRSVHGGISGVVNNYYAAGLDRQVRLRYIGTMREGSKLKKLLTFCIAFIIFLFVLPGYDIVHVNTASDSSYYRKTFFIRAARLFHKKIVIHQHGGDFETFYSRQLSERGRKSVQKVLSMGDVLLVLAPAWKEFFGTIIDENKIVILPDAIKIPEDQTKEYGKHRLLFLGRLCKAKGIGELLACVPELSRQYPDFQLYLAGIWEDQELKKEAEKYPEHVICPGWMSGEEKQEYLKQSDIFVLPSYFEGQSVSLLEAMAARCACVASDTGGIPYLLEQKQSGILVEPRNADSLLQGILEVMSDPELCSRLGERARATVEERFSLKENVEKLMDIYRRISR